MIEVMITQKELKRVLKYSPMTGDFIWISISKYHNEKKNIIAGCLVDGYVVIKIKRKAYKAHRLAWLYIYGYMPLMIDHKNGVKSQNNISNLRECTNSQNVKNHGRKISPSGLPTGVRKIPSGYQARIGYENKQISLGVFNTPKLAESAFFVKEKAVIWKFPS